MSRGKPYANIITPFRFEHLELMDLRDVEARMVSASGDKYQALATVGDGATLVYNGVVLAAFGWLPIWPQVYEVWVIPSIHVSRYPAVFLRTVRGYVDGMFRTHPIRRMQSPAIADRHHDRWMQHLGFVNETPHGMAGYGDDGTTYNMWARTA